MKMKLAVIANGQVFEVDLDGDLTDYDLTKSLPRAEICIGIEQAIKWAKRELGK
jgi:hypothetical protein